MRKLPTLALLLFAACHGRARTSTGDGGWATPFAEEPADADFRGIAVAPVASDRIELGDDEDDGGVTPRSPLLLQLRAIEKRCRAYPEDHGYAGVELVIVFDAKGPSNRRPSRSTSNPWPATRRRP